MRHVDRRRGRTPVHRPQPAGIAVGQDVDRLVGTLCLVGVANDLQAMAADGFADRDILVGDFTAQRAGPVHPFGRGHRQQGLPHAFQGPAKIHRGWTGGDQLPVGGFHGLVRRIVAQGEIHPVGGCRPDQRRPPYHHGPDRPAGIFQGPEVGDLESMGQTRLVDHIDRPAVAVEPDGAVGDAVDLHLRLTVTDPGRSLRISRRPPPFPNPTTAPAPRLGRHASTAWPVSPPPRQA